MQLDLGTLDGNRGRLCTMRQVSRRKLGVQRDPNWMLQSWDVLPSLSGVLTDTFIGATDRNRFPSFPRSGLKNQASGADQFL